MRLENSLGGVLEREPLKKLSSWKTSKLRKFWTLMSRPHTI